MAGRIALLGMLVAAGVACCGAAEASIVTPETLSDVVVTPGYTNSWYVTGTDLPSNQGNAVGPWLTSALGLSTATFVDTCSPCGATSMNNVGSITLSSPGADVFAVHFDSQELVFLYASDITSFTANLGSEQGLSNIQAFTVPTATQFSTTPIPGALLLFGTVLFGGLGVSSLRKRRDRGSASVMA